MNAWRSLLILSCAEIVLLINGGCQRGEVLGPVSGVVKCEGAPAPEGSMVLFRNDQKGVHMMAPCDREGRYEVKMAGGTGLPPGEYDVCVSPPIQDHPLGPIKARPSNDDPYLSTIPKKYRDVKTSGLKLTVKEEGTTFNIDMRRE